MRRPAHYKTKQREAILKYIASLQGSPVTVNQMAEYFHGQNAPIGTATIYRHLDHLVQEGRVKKHLIDGLPCACFEYIDTGDARHMNYHFKCDACGQLFHAQCEVIDELKHHIGDTHNFELDAGKTIFYGKCGACITKSS